MFTYIYYVIMFLNFFFLIFMIILLISRSSIHKSTELNFSKLTKKKSCTRNIIIQPSSCLNCALAHTNHHYYATVGFIDVTNNKK